MQCQHCGENKATMNLSMQINGQRMQMHMCNDCFSEMQGNIASGNIPSFNGNASDAFSNNFFQANGGNQARTQTRKRKEKKDNGLLDQLGQNVSDAARSGEIDPVIGRDHEIKRVVETLNRRNKNNRSEERRVGKECREQWSREG